jgi:glutaredoxin
MTDFIFYTRAGCSLCDQAQAVLDKQNIPYTAQSIAGDPALEAAYGWDIPVLFDAQTQKVVIKGVFGAARVRNLLANL